MNDLKSIVIILSIFLSLVSGQSTDECPCCTDAHQEFHFWIGDWNVYDTTGTLLGTNHIILDQDKCLMIENWSSNNSDFTGTSYNYYNNNDKSWNQLWIDNKGSNLKLKGGFINGKIILKSKIIKKKDTDNFYHRITWTPNNDGTVTQRWDVLDENNNLLNTAFLGIYKKH